MSIRVEFFSREDPTWILRCTAKGELTAEIEDFLRRDVLPTHPPRFMVTRGMTSDLAHALDLFQGATIWVSAWSFEEGRELTTEMLTELGGKDVRDPAIDQPLIRRLYLLLNEGGAEFRPVAMHLAEGPFVRSEPSGLP